MSDLHRAVLLDRVERVQAILAQRPRAVNAASAYGLSSLMVAAREGYGAMCALLLRRGANVNQQSRGAGKTALMFASFAVRRRRGSAIEGDTLKETVHRGKICIF